MPTIDLTAPIALASTAKKGEVMTKLIALLALAGAVAAAVFFWRKKEGSWESMWDSAKETPSSWGKTVAHETREAADTISTVVDSGTSAINDLAHEITDATTDATKKIDRATKKVSTAKADASAALADEAAKGPDTSQ
jgi:hypothetical protein